MSPTNNDHEREKWEQACLSELVRHGGTPINLRELRDYFRQLRMDQEVQSPDSNLIPE